MQLFGWQFQRKKEVDDSPSFVPQQHDDGAGVVAVGGGFTTIVDLDGTIRTEAELVTRYRDMALQPETDSAITDIVNESISTEEENLVEIDLSDVDISEKIKQIIRTEFQQCLNLTDFRRKGHDIYRRWYIDGRLYFHVVIDVNNPRDGIKELRYIDPRKIRKIREVIKKRIPGGEYGATVDVDKVQNEYYVYNDRGFGAVNKTTSMSQTAGLKIAKDAILHATSGITDNSGTLVLSYLHKAIKPLNQLRSMEDALIVYRLARAPERRIWYIDIGNLPKAKAEQYVKEIMTKHKNRLVYDSATGEIRDDRKFMTMLEDYWLPRREGGKGTEVTNLPGGQNLGQMDDVLFFQKKLYQSLNVPINRLNSEDTFTLGRSTETSRDEVKFNKFIQHLRTKFSLLFTKMLEKQLVLKGILSLEEWENISGRVKYIYSTDNAWSELKDAEIITGRINLMIQAAPLLGVYYSHEWARKNILHQSEDDIKVEDKTIDIELKDPRWQMPMPQEGDDQSGLPMPDGGTDISVGDGQPEIPQKVDPREKVRQAMIDYKLLASKKDGKSPQDKSKFRSAAQVLAKSGQKLDVKKT